MATEWWVRPYLGSEGVYGDGTGTSYENAWNGPADSEDSAVWGDEGVKAGDTLWICGLHVMNMTSWSTPRGVISVIPGESDSVRTVVRGDCPGDPAILWSVHLPSYHGPWIKTAGQNNVWELHTTPNLGSDWYFQDITATDHILLDRVNSVQEVEQLPGSVRYNAAEKVVYVHTAYSGDPTNRVFIPSFGYSLSFGDGNGFFDVHSITFFKVQMTGGSQKQPHHLTVRDSKFFYGGHSFFAVYDGMDYISVVHNEMGWAGNGIYTISSSNEAPSHLNFSYNYIHHIGVRESTGNADAHCLGFQGGTDVLVEGNLCQYTGTGITMYAWPRQEMNHYTVRNNFVISPHSHYGANGRGIETMVSNSANANKMNTFFYNNIVAYANSSSDSACYRLQFGDEQFLFNNIGYFCQVGLKSGRSQDFMVFDSGDSILLNTTFMHSRKVLLGSETGAGAKVACIRSTGQGPNVEGNFTYGAQTILNFTNGGPTEMKVGDTITGGTSGAQMTVRFLIFRGGAWLDGTAFGTFYGDVDGSFVENESFDLNSGQSDIVTLVGNTQKLYFQDGEDMLLDGFVVGRVVDRAIRGVKITGWNNMLLRPSSSHINYGTGAKFPYTWLRMDNDIYYPDGVFFGNYNFTQWQNDNKTGHLHEPNGQIVEPLFENLSGRMNESQDFYPAWNSPVIDAGQETDIVREFDFNRNPIYGKPDVGPFEYQPPFFLNSDPLNVGRTARAYNDGKYRYLDSSSDEGTLSLNVFPANGWPSLSTQARREDWMDITVTNSDPDSLEWVELGHSLTNNIITHSLSNLEGLRYQVSVNGTFDQITGIGNDCGSNWVCTTDSSHGLSFNLQGDYSSPLAFQMILTQELPVSLSPVLCFGPIHLFLLIFA